MSTREPGTPEGRTASGLEPFRRRLDFLDNEIARLLGERFEVVRKVALYKREHDIPMMQPGRIGATCKLEDELIAGA
jgi:chorismate mutase